MRIEIAAGTSGRAAAGSRSSTAAICSGTGTRTSAGTATLRHCNRGRCSQQRRRDNSGDIFHIIPHSGLFPLWNNKLNLVSFLKNAKMCTVIFRTTKLFTYIKRKEPRRSRVQSQQGRERISTLTPPGELAVEAIVPIDKAVLDGRHSH
jgi:hypothetical protein